MSKFKFKCKQCGKEKEVNTQQEAQERVYCSQKCVNLMFKEKYGQSKHAKESREIRMDKIAEVKTVKSKTEGVQMVDMEIPRKIYRRKEILLNLRDMSEKLGNKYPHEKEWEERKGIPSVKYIKKLFGSWKQAVSEAKTLPPKQVFTLSRTKMY